MPSSKVLTNFVVNKVASQEVYDYMLENNLIQEDELYLIVGDGGSYVLPPATVNTLGGIKVGTNLTVEADGTLSVSLAEVAKTGSYTDLINKPTIPQSMAGSAANSTTGISIVSHSTSTVRGVQDTTTTASKVTVSGSNGTAPTLGSPISVPNVTAPGSGSYTQGAFTGGSFSATVSGTTMSFSFTPATHASDSHTHVAPTLGTAINVPNVTSAGSASTWSISASDVTVPIRDTASKTVVTSATHTVTDSGHTHTVSVSS